MTAFGLTPGQRAFAAQVRGYAADELRPLAGGGLPGRVNRDLVKAMGRLGLLARLFPGAAAGQLSREASATDLCLLRESLAIHCTEAETALALQGLGSYPVLQSGRDEQVRRWLPAVAAGDAVAAFALSEPGAGSDAAALELAAEPDGDGWRLTGTKTWISNAPEADFYTVFARTTPGARARGVSAFLVPAGRPGLSGEHLDMVSPHPIGTLTFDGVPVHGDELLGELDRGFAVAMRTLDLFRPSVGAFAVGMAQAALDAALAYARNRTAFGGPLAGQQAVAHLLAEMATRTEAARLLVYSAAAALDDRDPPAGEAASQTGETGAAGATGVAGRSAMAKSPAGGAASQPGEAGAAGAVALAGRSAMAKSPAGGAASQPGETGAAGAVGVAGRSAMAKLFATETAQFVVDSAVQIHGARALQRGHLLEHLYREVRAPRIYEGASEIQRTIIARQLLTNPPHPT